MEIKFNPRENGACPMCRMVESCPVRGALAASVSRLRDAGGLGLELVIYGCPRFVEKF